MTVLVSPETSAVVDLVSRTGRHLQRYDHKGRRQVVGLLVLWVNYGDGAICHAQKKCIPYRYKCKRGDHSLVDEQELEVLVISSQKGKGLLFPKGGWEMDESIVAAALRETVEEAGVRGTIQMQLGQWRFKSKSQDAYYEGHMFPLLVDEQLDIWPEKNLRQRFWMNVAEAREACQQWWMKEALEVLVNRLTCRQYEEAL